jgi:predicted porin
MRRLALLGALLSAWTGVAVAQSSVALYGIIDTAMRFSTNANTAGNHALQLGDGAINGNRWGMLGKEDLGGGNQALISLESGFAPTTGVSEQGGRLFGRQAFVGLSGAMGTLLLGRQYTVAHDVMSNFEVLGFAGEEIMGFESPPYDGLRYDNTLKYLQSLHGFTVSLAHTFSNSTSFTAGSADAAGVVYTSGPFSAGVTYQVTHDVSSNYFNVVPAAQASKQSIAGLGAAYDAGRTKLFLAYMHNRLDVAGYTNNVVFAGANYAVSPSLHVLASLHYDWLNHLNSSGKRLTTYAMIDFAFSKRTDVYVEADYTRLRGAWVDLNANPNYSGSSFGNNNVTGAMVGLRHRF